MPDVASVLGGCTAVAYGLLALRLYTAGLARKYKVFFAFVIFHTFYVPLSLVLNQGSDVYFWFWVYTQPVALILYIWVVTELIGLVLARHRGFYTAGRWAMYAGIAVSAVISAATLLPKITPEMPQDTKRLWFCFAAERAVDFSLAIFLVLMVALLNFYAVPLSRNVLVHAVVFTMFFISSSLWTILRNVFGLKYVQPLDTALTAITLACILAWLFFLSPHGEEARVKAPWYGPEQEERILSQLDTINAALLKMARK
jgi:hypothetical protein